MKKKTWKRCVCMIGVVLFAVTGLNANNRVPDSPIKKTRSNTFIIEKEKAWEPAGEGVARQIMGYDGQVMLVKVKFEKATKWRILSTSCGVMLSNFVKPNPHKLISGAQVTSNIPPVCSDACMAVRKGLHQVIYLTMFFVPSVSLCRIHF